MSPSAPPSARCSRSWAAPRFIRSARRSGKTSSETYNMLRLSLFLLLPAAALLAQDVPLRVIAFGAHPDDWDIAPPGTPAKLAALGAAVKFVPVTNGDARHQSMGGGALAKRPRAEAEESGRRLGLAYEVLDNH